MRLPSCTGLSLPGKTRWVTARPTRLTSPPMADPLTYYPGRAVLSLDGPDTISLLERLVTNNTQDWSPGEARYGALLTPQGKVIADYIAQRTETGVLLDVDAEAREDLARRFKLFRLRAKVEIEPRDDLILACAAPGTPGAFPDPRHAQMPHRVFTTPEGLEPALDYDARRIACGVPEQGKDFASAEVFPSEINMDRHGGVDLKKGCFVGQEVVSRMHRRGKIRKRTLILSASPADASGIPPLSPANALPVTSSSQALGEATSASENKALARIRLDRLASALAAGGDLKLGEIPVTLEKSVWLQGEIAAFESHD